MYMAAGVSADVWEGEPPEDLAAIKPQIVEGLTRKLIEAAGIDGVDRLLLPLMGSGAADVGYEKAMRAMLRGINTGVGNNAAPKTVELVLYAKGKTVDERTEHLSELSHLAFRILNDGSTSGAWPRMARNLALAQLFFLIAAPLLAGVVACSMKHLPIIIGPGTIVSNTVKWALLGAGFFSIGQSSVFALDPLGWTQFVAVTVAAMVVPLWEWNKFGEPLDADGAGQEGNAAGGAVARSWSPRR